MLIDDLGVLINRVSGYDEEIASLEKAVSERKEARDKILEDDIPSLLHGEGLAFAPLADGRVVTIESIINVSQKDKAALLAWLEANGYDSIVKTEFQFAKGASTSELEDFLYALGIDYTKDISIHPQTIKKVMKDHIEGGGEYPPEEAAKVSVFERAKIKEAK